MKKMLARYPLGNPRRLWRQDNFVFSTFSPGLMSLDNDNERDTAIMRRSVKTCVEAGFNLLELGWASPERGKAAVRMSEQLGVGVIYQNLKRYGGMGKKQPWCEKNDLVGAMDEMRRWKCVVGYYLWDEPHTLEQMKNTRRMMDLCQRENPATLPFTVALPSYSKTCLWENGGYPAYITSFADVIDPPVMSFDYYPVGKQERFAEDYATRCGAQNDTVQLDETRMWCDMEYFSRAARERDIPFWFYYQGQNLHDVSHFRFSQTRLMAHAALLYGAKGLQHYAAWGCVVDPETGGHGPYFEDQKKLHADLKELGNVLMALQCERVIHDDALLPNNPYMASLRTPMSESTLLRGTLPYRTSISELTDEYGHKYLMVLNRDYLKDVTVSLSLNGTHRIYKPASADGEEAVLCDAADTLEVSLVPGGLALFRLQPVTEAPYTLEYFLEKDPA